MNREHVLGLATDLGSRTSHTAIMARSLGIPAVVGFARCERKAGERTGRCCSMAITACSFSIQRRRLSGITGSWNTDRSLVAEQLTGLRETKSTTRDGRHIVLSANIELPDDVEAVARNGAEGIGLYRTEFLYLNRATLPERGRAIRPLIAKWRSKCAASAHHPHLRSRRGQARVRTRFGDDEMNPFLGPARDPFFTRAPRYFQDAASGDYPGERGRQRQDHVPDDLRARGTATALSLSSTSAKRSCRRKANLRSRRSKSAP